MTAPFGQAVAMATTVGLDRAEWLELRRCGIGGSDAAVIAGLSPYTSPFELWLDKTGEAITDDDAGEAARWGRLLEPIVRTEVEVREGCTIESYPVQLRHPHDEHRIANLDGIVEFDDQADGLVRGVYEGKTASAWVAGDWAEGAVPDRYRIQGQHYLGVTGLPFVLFAVLIGGQRLVPARMERDDELIGHLWTLEDDFWDGVRCGFPPRPDGSKATTDLLTHLWDVTPDKVVEVSAADTLDLIGAYRDYLTAEKAARLAKDEVGNLLRLQLGDGEVAVSDDDAARVLYTWRHQPEQRVEAFTRKATRRLSIARGA